MTRIIGIPADGPELIDNISDHFGHCNYFVGVETDNNNLNKTFSIRNEGHSSCMEPVLNMRERNVTDMIIGDIGERPYMRFLKVVINLFQGLRGKTIKENIEFLLEGKLNELKGSSCNNH